jgi:hypothetical protein
MFTVMQVKDSAFFNLYGTYKIWNKEPTALTKENRAGQVRSFEDIRFKM